MKTKTFKDFIKTEPEDLFEFCNISDKFTGLDNIIIHAYSQADKQISHGPKLKVSNVYSKFRMDDCFVVDIKTSNVVEGEVKISSKELKSVKNWIALNKRQLLEYWKVGTEMDTMEFFDSLKRI